MTSTILYDIKLLDMGLVPTAKGSNISYQIEQLDSSEALRAKRKFRKAWRRAVRWRIIRVRRSGHQQTTKEKRIQDIKRAVGWNCAQPTRHHRKERDRLVRLWIWESIKENDND